MSDNNANMIHRFAEIMGEIAEDLSSLKSVQG